MTEGLVVPSEGGSLVALLVELGIEGSSLLVEGEVVGFSGLEERVKSFSSEGGSLVLEVYSELDGVVRPLSFDAIGGPWTLRSVRWDAVQRRLLLYGWQIAQSRCNKSMTIEEALRLVYDYRASQKKHRRGIFRRRSRS